MRKWYVALGVAVFYGLSIYFSFWLGQHRMDYFMYTACSTQAKVKMHRGDIYCSPAPHDL